MRSPGREDYLDHSPTAVKCLNIYNVNSYAVWPTANYVHSGSAKRRIAMHMLALWMPQRTAAVANPRRRLCIVAINHPNPGALRIFVLAIKAPVIGTNPSFPLRTRRGVKTSPLFSLKLTVICIQTTNDMHLYPGPAITSRATRWRWCLVKHKRTLIISSILNFV